MKMICVGRNYPAHAAELKNEVPAQPVLFLKPDTALLRNGGDFYIPEFSSDVHYECEVVFRIGKLGKHVQRKYALNYLDGVGVGIDFTARDVQQELKSKGLPWEIAKAFDRSTPISEMMPISRFPSVSNLSFELKLNGETRQQGNTSAMLFDIAFLIEYISKYFTLKMGDYIFTGTPAGVGKVAIGDRLEAFLEGEKLLDFGIK